MDIAYLLPLFENHLSPTSWTLPLGKALFSGFPLFESGAFLRYTKSAPSKMAMFRCEHDGSTQEHLGSKSPELFTAERLEERLGQGFTVVVRDLDQRPAALQQLQEALVARGWQDMNTALFECRAGSPEIEWHWDPFPMIVLQCAGESDWAVCTPLVTPTSDEQIAKAYIENDFGQRITKEDHRQIGNSMMVSTHLETGQALFVPTAWPHKRLPQTEDSVHLLIGPSNTNDLILRALAEK